MLSQVAAFVFDCVLVAKLSQKLYFLDDVLPFLHKEKQFELYILGSHRNEIIDFLVTNIYVP